jgi:hypothetical protein
VAGKERAGPDFTTWVRPVSSRPAREISFEERRYENGDDPAILDIIRILMTAPCPESYQTENHLIDSDYYWERKGHATWQQVLGALDKVSGPLWMNGSSTYNGHNDQVQEQAASAIKHSLVLIRPSGLTVSVAREGGVYAPAKRKVRASFSFNGNYYRLTVTDPNIEYQYLQGQDGQFPVFGLCSMCELGRTL